MIERYQIVNKYDDTPVGANPCVRPLDAQYICPFGLKGQTHDIKGQTHGIANKGQTHGIANKGQTHGIANKGQTHGIANKGQTHGIANKGQTHGSAPTYKYNRRSIRLPHYDYSKAGYYFITITAHNREHLFGEMVDGKMVLNMAGEMVHKWYEKLEEKFPSVKNDMMVIMPNHIHFIVRILQPVGANPCVRPLSQSKTSHIVLGDIIQWFKTMTTNTYIKMVKNNTLPPFNKRIWQRNYYEHVVRDENDYVRIAEYIENNPSTWNDDMLNT